jgi:hypothetical protein
MVVKHIIVPLKINSGCICSRYSMNLGLNKNFLDAIEL